MAGFLSRLVTKICRVLTTRKTVDDDEVAPRRNKVRTFKVPDQNLLTTRTMDDEDAPGLKAVPNFQVPDEVEPEDVIDPAEMNTLESRLGSLIQHDTITRVPAFKVELFGALRSGLYDSNKNLIMATLTSINGLESAMGPAIEKSSKGIVSDIVKCIGENKKHMRECTSWVASTDLDKMVQYITPSMTPMTDAKLGADGRMDLFDRLSKQLAIQLRPKIRMSNQLSKQLVMKNVSDIQGPTLAIVLERLKSHGVFPEVHDKTRATRTGPTVKTTSKIRKSNWLSKQLAIQLLRPVAVAMTDKSADVCKAAEGFFGDIVRVCGPQIVKKNVRDIHGLALAIVLERLKSHGVFPEVHDKTRVSRTGPTVKTTSKIVKSNWLSKQLAIHVYLQELGIDEIRRRVGARENDLHMLKTLLYELCKLRGTAITGHLSMVPIDMEPQPIILAYIDLNLQTLAAARLLTTTRPTGQTQWGDSMGNNPMPAAHCAGAQLKFVSFLYFKRGVSAKGSKAESIMSVQDKSRPMGSRLVFTPKEPQRERHPMPQPSVIGPTNWYEATPTSVEGMKVICQEFEAINVPSASTEIPSGNGMEIDNSDLTFGIHPFYIKKSFVGSKSRRWKDEFSTRPRKVLWTFWFTDKLIRTGYSGVFQKKK
ncbi:protein MOR1 [Tanacetum coccineum]